MSSDSCPFYIQTVSGELPHVLPDNSHLLAAIGMTGAARVLETERPVFTIGLPLLTGDSASELWLSAMPVRYGSHADVIYAENSDVLFGHILLDENAFPDFRYVSQAAYRQVFEALRQSGYPYLLRMWNYFPNITRIGDNTLNRYQVFCLGRQDALDAYGNFEYSPPAATAIGTQSPGFQLYFLAAKSPGIQLENPRQTSAFLYPRQYGPVSPAFSRATVKAWGVEDTPASKHIYISGTTSIVGHETLHQGNPLAQLDETLENLEALLRHGDAALQLPANSIHALRQLKIYLHDATHLPAVQQRLEAYLSSLPHDERNSRPDILYLQGDVCRSDLMVEIEGIHA